eukprot:15329547-Ditylum_brightwellii.AAC.1
MCQETKLIFLQPAVELCIDGKILDKWNRGGPPNAPGAESGISPRVEEWCPQTPIVEAQNSQASTICRDNAQTGLLTMVR